MTSSRRTPSRSTCPALERKWSRSLPDGEPSAVLGICGMSTMNDAAPKPTSIRRRLLIFLISSAALMVSCAALVTYWVALHLANNAYDRALLDPALHIADNVR